MHRRVMGCLASGLALVSTVTPVQGEEWPSTDWTPVCFEDMGQGGTCDLGDPGVEVSVNALEAASRALSSAGFRPPNLSLPYTVHMWSNKACYRNDGDTRCVPGYYVTGGDLMVLSYDANIAMGDTVKFGPHEEDWLETTEYSDTAIHELAHAVQDAYPGLPDAGKWITEGTATAIAAALDGIAAPSGSGLPFLDTPLNAPLSLPVTSLFRSEDAHSPPDYVNYPFWLWVARNYGGPLPGGIRAFHDLYLGLSDQPASAGGGSDPSVGRADAGLRKLDDEGLFNIYPAYIADFGNEPRLYQRVHNAEHNQVLASAAPDQNATITIAGRQASLTTWAYSLVVAGQPGAALEIRLVEPEDGLHLIIDDRRVDTVETGSGGIANRFFQSRAANGEDGERQEYLIRVANAGRDPTQFRPRPFTFEATIFNEYAYVSGLNPRRTGSTTSAEIDTPVEMEFSRRKAYLMPVRTEYSDAAGIRSPCYLRLHFIGRPHQDEADVIIVNEGPISTGEYPLMSMNPGKGLKIEPEKYPGQFLSGFELGQGNPMSEGQQQTYDTQGGSISIDRLTPDWIEGHIRMAGVRRGKATYGQKLTGPANLEIAIRFSLPVTKLPGQAAYLPPAECTGPSVLR